MDRLRWTWLISSCSCAMWDVLLKLRCSLTQVTVRLASKQTSNFFLTMTPDSTLQITVKVTSQEWYLPQTSKCIWEKIQEKPDESYAKTSCTICFRVLKKFRQFIKSHSLFLVKFLYRPVNKNYIINRLLSAIIVLCEVYSLLFTRPVFKSVTILPWVGMWHKCLSLSNAVKYFPLIKFKS